MVDDEVIRLDTASEVASNGRTIGALRRASKNVSS